MHNIGNCFSPNVSKRELPKISILTPNFNYEHFIEETLRSVIGQEYSNLEYIVIDDGSTDSSVAVIERFKNKLATSYSRPNEGQYRTITEGLNAANGEIMGWLNSDDRHHPWTLAAVGEIFDQFPDVEWISTLHLGGWDWQGYPTGFSQNRGFSSIAYFEGRYLPGPAVLKSSVPPSCREYIQQESTFWRKSLWEKAGSYVSSEYGSAGDFELWGRFFQHAELVAVDIPLAGFRHQQGQQTSQISKYADFCSRALRDHRIARSGWKMNTARKQLLRMQAWRWPRLGKYLAKRFGYQGARIVRSNQNKPNVSWTLEKHDFF
jgi:glycosyltransferase involved in cell wall biosynthesis